MFFDKKSTFSALVCYYARKLRDPQAVGELWGFLWLTMKLHPEKCDRYYAVCLRNEYIRLAKNESATVCTCANVCAPEMDYDDTFETLPDLTPKQREVLRLRYGLQYTIDEIATAKGISRQAVNQMVKKALENLRLKMRY